MILLAPNSPLVCKEVTRCCREEQHLQQWLSCSSYSSRRRPPLGYFRFRSSGDRPSQVKRGSGLLGAFWPDSTRPVAEMESIEDCDQLDRVLLHAQELSQPILIDWMATWCRKCIYLKPKLEKLAAEYDSKIKFYCVDVNKVPQTLVKRGNISKMPTIQVWKDGEMKAEVIGGHKAWLVIEEVREMIQKFV